MLEGIAAASTATGATASLDLARTASAGASQLPVGSPHADFGSVLAQVAMDAADVVRAGEATAVGGIKGQIPIQQVVEAVMAAEQTLQGAIAIRDKAVAAYMEISRMAI